MIGAGVVSMKHFQHKRWFDEGGETAGNREPANLAYATANLCVTPEPKTKMSYSQNFPEHFKQKREGSTRENVFNPGRGYAVRFLGQNARRLQARVPSRR